jgi:Metal binding domain of Ada
MPAVFPGSSHENTGSRVERDVKRYRLIGSDGRELLSETPGTLGGHRRTKVYGRLDCPSALRWITRGHYVRHRVFFADEETAIAAGYRPCAVCLPAEYRAWRDTSETDVVRARRRG